MFGRKKKEQVTINTRDIDKNEVAEYLDAFMHNNNINPKMVLVQGILTEPTEDGCKVIILAAFPGNLLGKHGEISSKLARGLSKLFDCKLKLIVRER